MIEEDSSIDLVRMAGHEDWIMRPVLRGLCKYESLKNGDLDLYDVDLMNEAIDVEEENKSKLIEAMKNGR